MPVLRSAHPVIHHSGVANVSQKHETSLLLENLATNLLAPHFLKSKHYGLKPRLVLTTFCSLINTDRRYCSEPNKPKS